MERNVLPVLNNLLENREMQLEDGRFLLSPRRSKDMVVGKMVQVHPDFRVIALGVPVPPFPVSDSTNSSAFSGPVQPLLSLLISSPSFFSPSSSFFQPLERNNP